LNVAVQDLFASTVTVADPVPEQLPDQPAKDEPDAGVALRVTEVPLLKFAEQVLPQLMPAGELVTVPLPVPAFTTERPKAWMTDGVVAHDSGE
jgi:hypothetical protein